MNHLEDAVVKAMTAERDRLRAKVERLKQDKPPTLVHKCNQLYTSVTSKKEGAG